MTKKILVIDDSATSLALFKASMSGCKDYQIFTESDPAKAVDLAKTEKPFLIIVDYNMPEQSGADLAKNIQGLGIEAYFVLMTANTQDSVVEEIKSLGFVDVLEKPISTEKIMVMLEKLS